jgi:amino acid permease
MASKLSLWHKGGRFFSGLVIILFFLPFFGVSCQGMDVISVSGTDMVAGCKPGGLASEASEGPSTGASSVSVEKVPREPLAIVAFLLAVAVFATAWVRTRGALVAACVLAFAGVLALGGLWFVVGGKLNDQVVEAMKKDQGGVGGAASEMTKDVMKDVETGSRFGLWLSALGLLGVGSLTLLALRERAPAEGREPVGAPPPA